MPSSNFHFAGSMVPTPGSSNSSDQTSFHAGPAGRVVADRVVTERQIAERRVLAAERVVGLVDGELVVVVVVVVVDDVAPATDNIRIAAIHRIVARVTRQPPGLQRTICRISRKPSPPSPDDPPFDVGVLYPRRRFLAKSP
jgi:hypothetical protein